MKCPLQSCGIELRTQAEAFLHRELHREPWAGFGLNATNLHSLPYALMPRVARLMQDYSDHKMRELAGEDQIEGLSSLQVQGEPQPPLPEREGE